MGAARRRKLVAGAAVVEKGAAARAEEERVVHNRHQPTEQIHRQDGALAAFFAHQLIGEAVVPQTGALRVRIIVDERA